MSEATWLVGDVFDRLAGIPDGSVDLVLTSPPFLALRSYLPADHPDKGKEIGSEPTPAEFLDTLLALTAEWRRVLAPHGSIAVELGDTYAGSGGAGGDYLNAGLREGQPQFDGSSARNRAIERAAAYDGGASDRHDFAKPGTRSRLSAGPGWPLDKSLCGIPHLYHLSLAYGRNLLTGQPSPAGQWRVRNVVAWVRPNPPVGALGDKFRPGTSYMTVATIARDRYFDLDAVRTPSDYDRPNLRGKGSRPGGTPDGQRPNTSDHTVNPAGAPPLDWWEIPTQPYKGAHYATWPERLCVRPILAMTPQRVCTTCGRPARRIVGEARYVNNAGRPASYDMSQERVAEGVRQFHTTGDNSAHRIAETVGWSDCGHDTWRPGHVLDPFAGSGTTLAVATGHGRDATGIDLDPRNADLARDRIGMFLTINEPAVPEAS